MGRLAPLLIVGSIRAGSRGVQPPQPAATSYPAYMRTEDYMNGFQGAPLFLNNNAAAGLTGGLLTESDFFKIYNQPGIAGAVGPAVWHHSGDERRTGNFVLVTS
jgi:hypothetical protein